MTQTRDLQPADLKIPLRLLATTDLHGHLLSYDYFADRSRPQPSLSRIATLVGQERAGASNTLLLDNGDFLQGTPLADLASDLTPEAIAHPVVTAMNHLCYDAIALGNHEFNTPLPRLQDILSQIDAPLLCANLVPTERAPANIKNSWQPHLILKRQLVDDLGQEHLVRIGLFGVLPPQVMNWDHSRVAGCLAAMDSLAAGRHSVAALRAAGADIVIGLGHTGIDTAPERDDMENSGLHMAAIEGLDVLILGHTHLRFPEPSAPRHPAIDIAKGTLHGTSVMQPGSAAACLGRIDLSLTRKNGRWQVDAEPAQLIDSRDAEEDPDLVAKLAPAHDWALNQLRKPIGHIAEPIHSYLSVLSGCASVRIVGEALEAFTQARLEGTRWESLPVLAAAAPQKSGGRGGPTHFTNISAGPVALNNVTDLQFFPNDVSALRLNGSELADWLEMSASFFRQLTPGEVDQPLCCPDFPVYNCDTIFGLTYEIDLSQPARYTPEGTLVNPAARRIRNLGWRGRPLSAAQEFALAANNYRAGGGGAFPHAGPDRILFEDSTKIRDILVRAFREGDPSANPADAPWRFTRLHKTAAWFDTSPALCETLQQTTDGRLNILGETPEGFLRLRLTFD